MPTIYDINPKPTTGSGTATGMVPGAIGLPPNIYAGVQSIYPGLGNMTGNAGRVIQSELKGELSPETINAIQDEAARFGVASGMPGSQFSGNRGLRNLGLSVEGRQRQGVQDFGGFLGGLGRTVTDPGLAAEIASRNALMGSAPDPALATNAQLAAYWAALRSGSGAGRGPSGGTMDPLADARSWAAGNEASRDDQMRQRQAYSDNWWAGQNPAGGTGVQANNFGGDMSLEDWYGATYGDFGNDYMNWDFEEGY